MSDRLEDERRWLYEALPVYVNSEAVLKKIQDRFLKLIAEIKRLREENRLFDKDNIRNMNTGKGAIERLTKERDELRDKLAQNWVGRTHERIVELESENAELKEKLNHA